MMPFRYLRAASVEGAVAAMRDTPDALFLSGGMTLLPLLQQRLAAPGALVDIGRIAALRFVERHGDTLVVGAATTHDAVARAPEVRDAIPALAALAGAIGDPQVRNRGTLGGALATNHPAGDYPAAALALDAVVVTDRRRLAADAFFTGPYATALHRDEPIVEVAFPIPRRAGWAKFEQPASRYALAGVMVAERQGAVRVAVTGTRGTAFRHRPMEAALAGDFSPAALDAIGTEPDGERADVHASADYRAHLSRVMAARAVARALADDGLR